jgi:hypothetical protein
MKLRIFTFAFLLLFSAGNAYAGIWDIFSAPYNYVADLFSGDDTEVATGNSVVANDPSMRVESEEAPLDDDLGLADTSLSLGNHLGTDFFNTRFLAPYQPSPLTLSPITSTTGAYYPSNFTMGNYSSPLYGNGLIGPPLSYGPQMPQTCSVFDYSLCVFCYSPSFSLIDDLYKNQCDSLYKDVPDERSDKDTDAYCQCHEDKNKEMFAKPEVKDFIKDAVEKKKAEVAAEVVASFQTIAKGVGLADGHPYFGLFYDGTKGKRPEGACKPNNFKNIIANLAKPNREGSAPCKQESLKKMFDLAAEQAEKCNEKKTFGSGRKSGSRSEHKGGGHWAEVRKKFSTFKGSDKEKEFCETFGSLDGLKEKLKFVEPNDFDGVVAGFSEIFEQKVNGEISEMANAVGGRRDVGLLLGSFGSRMKELRDWKKETGQTFTWGDRRPASEETSMEDNDGGRRAYIPMHAHVSGAPSGQIIHDMTTNTNDFAQTFDPNLYFQKAQELFSSEDSCNGDQCFDMVRVLSTEPYLMGPWMQQAKDEVPLSEEMLKLIQDHRVLRFRDGEDQRVGLNVLTPDQKKALSDHSKKVLDKFKSKAFHFMKVQNEKELPRNITELQNTQKQLESRLASAMRQGNVDVTANLQQQIDLTKATIEKMNMLKGHLGNMTKDAGAFTLKNIEEAMTAMWDLQSHQLDQGCKAVQDQVELYCRLNEQPEMYSASDVLGLDFNNNKKIAAEFDKGKSASEGSTSKLAILDAMTCMEKGKFSQYPKSGDDLFFINGAGELDECHSKIKEDNFPKFQSDVLGGGGYSTMIVAKETWEGWNRCEGKEFKTRTSTYGDSQNIKERIDNGQGKEGSSFDDVGKITLGDIADSYKQKVSGGSDDTIAQLEKFKEKYGDISSPSNYSDDFFEKISLKSEKGKLADSSNGEIIEDVIDEREVTIDGKASRGPASEKSNGDTVVQSNGTVQYNPLYNRSGQPVASDNLEKIDEQLSNNNQQLENSDKVTKEIQTRIDQAGTEGVDQSVLDQLDALRKQIEELKSDNEKLALDRKIEIEKLKREELEASIAAASGSSGVNTKPVVEDRPANFNTAPAAKVTTTSGNGSNGVIGGTSNGGVVSNGTGGFVENTANVVPSGSNSATVAQGKTGQNSGNRGVFLTGTTSSGEQFNISSGEVLNFEGRSDVTSFDSAVAIALQSSKNAFVYDGKFYVKKGEKFVEVTDVKEKDRAVASEEEVKDLKGVSDLLDRLKEEDKEKEEEPAKVVPVVEVTDKEPASDDDDRKKVKSLWRIIIDNINPFK